MLGLAQLPTELQLEVVAHAAAADRQQALLLTRVSRRVRRAALPALYGRVHLVHGDGVALFLRSLAGNASLEPLVRELALEDRSRGGLASWSDAPAPDVLERGTVEERKQCAAWLAFAALLRRLAARGQLRSLALSSTALVRLLTTFPEAPSPASVLSAEVASPCPLQHLALSGADAVQPQVLRLFAPEALTIYGCHCVWSQPAAWQSLLAAAGAADGPGSTRGPTAVQLVLSTLPALDFFLPALLSITPFMPATTVLSVRDGNDRKTLRKMLQAARALQTMPPGAWEVRRWHTGVRTSHTAAERADWLSGACFAEPEDLSASARPDAGSCACPTRSSGAGAESSAVAQAVAIADAASPPRGSPSSRQARISSGRVSSGSQRPERWCGCYIPTTAYDAGGRGSPSVESVLAKLSLPPLGRQIGGLATDDVVKEAIQAALRPTRRALPGLPAAAAVAEMASDALCSLHRRPTHAPAYVAVPSLEDAERQQHAAAATQA
jgi:hypothetical protein